MEEKIIMEGLANHIKSRFNVQNGRGILTNKRFIYCKHGVAQTLVLGMWVNLTKGDYDHEIPLTDIKNAEIRKNGLGHKLTITTRDNEIYQYGISKALDWEIAFNNVLSGRDQSQGDTPEPAADVQKNFCPNCGAKLQESDKFCPNCGAKI
jgi:hypothetical protein